MADLNACSMPASSGTFPMPCVAGWPKLRAGTQLDAMYERLQRDGFSFTRPGADPKNPHVLVVFDPQCYWSNHFWKTTRALEDKVFFIWFAVCVSADVSTAQAACMLAAENPWEVFCRHEESFDDPDFCGIHPEDYAVSQDDRNRVWRNARVFRKAGGTQVPLGIFRKPDGSFVPLFGDDTLSEIKQKIGL